MLYLNKLNKQSFYDELAPIFDHVGTYYLRGRRRGRGYSQPMFPIPVWNCYERVIAGLLRTTNPAEGWHNRLHFTMDKAHPSFTECLQNTSE